MTMKHKLTHKILSLVLSICMLFAVIPLSQINTHADEKHDYPEVADASTVDGWKEFFPIGNDVNTENAGGVWTDKSVFTDASHFTSGISVKEKNSLLVALSAIASNKTITGVAATPTDTMIILDLSSSMYGATKDPANVNLMVTAVNNSIKKLMQLNVHNRAGVVIYYGGPSVYTQSLGTDSMVLLPLGRYSETASAYIETVLDGTQLKSIRTCASLGVTQVTHNVGYPAGTYMQQGIHNALDEFLKADTTVPLTASTQAGADRMPIFVLMSDGEPTAGNDAYADRNHPNSEMGNNRVDDRYPAEIDFVTQLTASWAKEMVDAHYEKTAPQFYTLSLGTSVSLDIMDPSNQVATPGTVTGTIQSYWESLVNNGTVTFKTKVYQSGDNPQPHGDGPTKIVDHVVNKTQITKNSTFVADFPTNGKQKLYVNKAFTAATASDLGSMFDQIINDISIQAQYHPTLVEESIKHSGFVSFVDKIGKYMYVSDIKGITVGDNVLFSGADLASNFVAGGGALISGGVPTALGNEFVWAVQERLGLASPQEAADLISSAYNSGQLSYKSATEFSNYIGWFADAAGKYLGFWEEGTTTIPSGAKYYVKSYGYLGEVNQHEKSDMMYATVQVREDIETGEQMLTFAVPAALVPIITYSVELDHNNDAENLTVSGATAPIRLVYEVALNKDINEFTLNDVVAKDYIDANTNSAGAVNFYTNQYEVDNTTGYGKVNTYSYFRPSRENDRYYYQNQSYVYVDEAGTVYQGAQRPTGTKYHAYDVYWKNGTTVGMTTKYHTLQSETLATAEPEDATPTATTKWYIPKGDVRRDYTGFVIGKQPSGTTPANVTGTLPFSAAPFTDIHNHNVNDLGHTFVVGSTLGNNGRIALASESGIKITKELISDATTTTTPFDFVLENITNAGDNNEYAAYLTDVDGTASDTKVTFASGKANISLMAGQELYIAGIAVGTVIRVREVQTRAHNLVSINKEALESIDLTVEQNKFVVADFVNEDRANGNFLLEKLIEHPDGEEYIAEVDREFTFELTLELCGAPLANEQLNGGEYTTDENGKLTVKLRHNQSLELVGLPEDTLVTAKEIDAGELFTEAYLINGVKVDTQYATVVVPKGETGVITVINEYNPPEEKQDPPPKDKTKKQPKENKKQPKENPPEIAKTGEGLWIYYIFAIMLASFMGLLLTVNLKKRKT